VKTKKWLDKFGCIVEGTPGELLNGQVNPAEVLGLIEKYGVVLFRGFNASVENFKDFGDSFPVRFGPYGGGARHRPNITPDGTVFGASTGTHYICLHGEMYHHKNPPDLLWFHCELPSLEGGKTTLADGEEFTNELSPRLRALFEENRVKYNFVTPKEVWKASKPDLSAIELLEAIKGTPESDLISVLPDESLSYEYVTSVFSSRNEKAYVNMVANCLQDNHKYATAGRPPVVFENDNVIGPEVIEELFAVERRIIEEIVWETGDFAILDNHRMMHGRSAFSGPRKVCSRISYGLET